LVGRSPLAGRWKVQRDGKLLAEHDGHELEVPISEPGNYRAEVWLNVAGEKKIWILSNPVYIRPPGQ
jgi:hypothetical protein